MTRKIAFALGLLMALLPLWGRAQTTREVLQPQFGKQTITVASNEVITFKDPKGDTDYTGTTAENAQSLTVFQPAEAGMSIQITFESMNMGGKGGYYSFANVYNGNPDADNTFTWATATNEVATTYAESNLPAGNILRAFPNEQNQTYTDETYFSTTADGIIAVGFTYRYAYSCKGWTATVKAVKLEDMAVTGAGSNYDGVVASPKSKQNVALANAYVTTTGVMNADHITAIHFDLTQNEGAVEPTALRLYKGNAQVSATVATDGTGYKFTLDEALNEGTNTFAIKGDFLGTAAIGAKAQIDITKITTTAHPDGVAPFTAATAIAVSTPAVVLMAADPQTITVTETALNFYDEGGADGVMPGTASGQVTFLSGVAGKKVMVDFSMTDLNNGSIYFQSIKVYNGTETTEANLLREFRSGETGLVRSTAADGALTVVLTGALQNYAEDGWVAIVSLFTPQAMDFDAIEVAQYQKGTVCFGDINQRIIDINVKAIYTEPAMQVERMNFTTNGTNDIVTKATLFYTKSSNEFSASETYKVGETAITTDAFEITLTTPATLTEGDNRFWLCYDISDEAQNGQTIDAALISVTANVNGAEKTENATNGNPDGHRTVQNTVLSYADMGTLTKTISGTVRFETKKSGSSDYCESGSDERINIFVPKHTGMVCQIDFKEFEVQYASTSYGVKSTFKIYAGQGTTGDLLWELSSTDQQTGPGRIVRSTAADGALTIVFNPNNSYSYTYKGFKATVSEYQSQPMQVERVEASQAITADVSVGAKKQELIDVNVFTNGNLNTLSVSELSFDLKGLQQNLEKVYVAQNGTVLGEADVTDAQTITVTFATPFELSEGNNIFSLLADIASTAPEGATIDAMVVSATVDGNTIAATSGDPDGARVVKYIYIIQPTTNIVTVTEPLLFYDDGGPESKITKGFKGTTIFVPGRTNSTVKLNTLSTFSIGSGKMYIYSGREANKDSILGTITGYTTINGPINLVSKAADGSLTVVFEANTTATTLNGWEIEVSLEEKVPYAIDNIEVTNTSNDVMRNSQNNVMHQIKLSIVGHKTPFAITQLKFYAQGAEQLANAKVYFTQRSNIFGINSLIGTTSTLTNGENTISLSDRLIINDNGDYYLWLTYDISAEAVAGNTVSAQLSSINTTTVSANVAERTIKAGIKGFYIIGASDTAHYASFAQATSALQGGIEGAVTLLVEPGIYAEQVKIANVNGVSEQNTLTIRSITGKVADAIVQLNVAPSVGYGEKVGGLISITNTPWVSIENLSVHTTATGFDAMVQFTDGCHHCSVRNCSLKSPYVGGSYSGTRLVHVQGIEGRNSNYALIENSYLEGGYNGIYFNGTGAVALPMQQGGRVINNQFVNNTKAAIYAYRENMLTVEGNSISNSNATNDLWAIDAQLTGNARICGNSITSSGSNKAVIGIYLRDMNVVGDKRLGRNLIANNEIIIGNTSGTLYGINFSDAVENCDVVFNSIRLVQGSSASAGIAFLGKAASPMNGTTVINNLIHNEVGGYVYRVNNAAHAAQMQFHHNGLYTTNPDVFAYLGEDKTWDEWKSAATETGSVVAQPAYISSNLMILDPNGATTSMFVGVPLNEVPTDINGTLRSLTTPTIGAYEYTPDMVPTMLTGYPKVLTAIDGNASIAVRTDVAATVYCIVLKATEAAPTADELKASAFKLDVAADREASIEVSGLEIGAEYIAYLLPVSLRGTDGTMSQTTAFTMAETPAPIAVPVADVYINNSTTEWTIAAGESVTLMAMVTVDERSAPYTLTWMDSKRNVLLTQTYSQADDIDALFTAVHTPTECTDYTFQVSDNAANTTTATVRAIVTGDAITATFENLYLDSESFWNAQTSDGSDNAASFVSGSYKFPAWNQYGGTYWYGYAYANQTSAAFSGLADQYHSATGGGYNGSENYVVHFVSAWDAPQKIEVLNNAEGDIISGFYVTNTAYAINSMTNGDGFAKKFEQGDWFKLTATGDNGNTAEFYLADFRSDNPADHYILDTWQWFDLSVLGQVKSISFAMSSSDNGAYGMNTPSYFCLDNFGGTRSICNPVTHEFSDATCGSYDWNGTVYDASGDYMQTLTAANGCDSTVTLHLTINQPVTHEFTEVAEGKYVWNGTEYTQSGDYVQSFTAVNGCDSTVTLHLTITNGSQTGLISIERESLSAYPNPTTGELWLTVPELVEGTAAAEVLVYSINGQLLLRVPMRASAGSAPAAGRIRIDLSGYPAGIYIVRMGRAVAKVIKQ